MTANRSVGTGLTSSAVISVCRLESFRLPHSNNGIFYSPGSGRQPSLRHRLLDMTTGSPAHFGLPLVAAR